MERLASEEPAFLTFCGIFSPGVRTACAGDLRGSRWGCFRDAHRPLPHRGLSDSICGGVLHFGILRLVDSLATLNPRLPSFLGSIDFACFAKGGASSLKHMH